MTPINDYDCIARLVPLIEDVYQITQTETGTPETGAVVTQITTRDGTVYTVKLERLVNLRAFLVTVTAPGKDTRRGTVPSGSAASLETAYPDYYADWPCQYNDATRTLTHKNPTPAPVRHIRRGKGNAVHAYGGGGQFCGAGNNTIGTRKVYRVQETTDPITCKTCLKRLAER